MTQLLQNTLYGTALILAAALLRRTLKDRFLPEARLCLWALCLFRLLTPAAPESALSLWGLTMIMNYKKPTLLSTVLTPLLVLSLSVTLGTSPATAAP